MMSSAALARPPLAVPPFAWIAASMSVFAFSMFYTFSSSEAAWQTTAIAASAIAIIFFISMSLILADYMQLLCH